MLLPNAKTIVCIQCSFLTWRTLEVKRARESDLTFWNPSPDSTKFFGGKCYIQLVTPKLEQLGWTINGKIRFGRPNPAVQKGLWWAFSKIQTVAESGFGATELTVNLEKRKMWTWFPPPPNHWVNFRGHITILCLFRENHATIFCQLKTTSESCLTEGAGIEGLKTFATLSLCLCNFASEKNSAVHFQFFELIIWNSGADFRFFRCYYFC